MVVPFHEIDVIPDDFASMAHVGIFDEWSRIIRSLDHDPVPSRLHRDLEEIHDIIIMPDDLSENLGGFPWQCGSFSGFEHGIHVDDIGIRFHSTQPLD